jgi:hypothetical protein
VLDDIKPHDISLKYSIDLLTMISTMLSSERDDRPTASQIKDELKTIALKLFQPKTEKCRMCQETFPSRNSLSKYFENTRHNRMINNTDGAGLTKENELTIRGYAEASGLSVTDGDLRIRGCADAPVHNHYDE